MAGEIEAFLGGFSGSTIGSAVVKLFLDDNAYQAELAAAEAKTGTATTGMGSKFGAFKTAALGAFAVAGSAAVQFVGSSIAAFNEAEAAMAQTEAAIRSTGGAAGFTAEELAELASGFQDTTRFSDEAVLSLENMLLTFTNIGHDEVPTATQAILDYATAMNVDLKAATIQVGKALNDPIKGLTALARGGTQFSAEQVDLIENFVEQNDLMSAQRVILEELATQYGGSAAAALDTFAGKQEQLNNKFNDFQERVGGVATTGVVGLVDAIGGWVRVNDLLNGQLVFLGSEQEHVAVTAEVGAAAVDSAADAFSSAAGKAADATRKIRQFANLTGEDLQEWRAGVIEDIRGTFGTISELGNRFTLSAKDLEKSADQARRQTERYAKDIEKLGELDIAESIKKALLDEGPAAVDAFVRANSEGRRNIIEDIRGQLQAERDAIKGVEEMTGKIENLGKTTAIADVKVR